MRMIGTLFGAALPARAPLVCLAAVVALAAGCSSLPRSHVAPPPIGSDGPPARSEHPATVEPDRGEFAIAASMLATWNAVGQILVRADGVTYEGRAQMLGIYVVRYRGEKFLILTRAVVMRTPAQGMVTQVGAVLLDGKPNGSPAAVELLGLLQRRLPAELARMAAGDSDG